MGVELMWWVLGQAQGPCPAHVGMAGGPIEDSPELGAWLNTPSASQLHSADSAPFVCFVFSR